MKKIVLVLILAMGLCGSLASATKTLDRRGQARAAYKIFPALVAYVKQSRGFAQLPQEQQQIINQVHQRATQWEVPLRFDPDPANFAVNPGEPLRLMRT